MKRVLLIILVLLMFSGCGIFEHEEPTETLNNKTNAFWNNDSQLYSFVLDGKTYRFNSDLPDKLIYDEYVNNIDDVGLLVKIGYNSSDSKNVYCKIDENKVSAVRFSDNGNYITIELKFKMIDGRSGSYKFNKITENSDFYWFGESIGVSPERMIEILGEPTSIKKTDSGTIETLTYNEGSEKALQVDFVGDRLYGIIFTFKK